jgi:predicted MFS family arabinose efflux permease
VAELLAGVRVLWRNPMLRAASVAVAVLNTAGAPLVIITVVILTDHGTPEWMIGVAMSGLALGGLAGAALVKPLHRRLRPGVVLLVVLAMQVPVFVALAVPLGPWWVMCVLFYAMLGVPALSVLLDVLIFRQVPAHQRGRVIGAATTLFGAGAPLGAVAAGLLLQYLSAAGAMLVLAAFLALAVTYVGSRQELRRAEWPAD